ncbi:hypothetical protein BO94DRAFT_575665 [Aspergillus sclerotioniger CBS 115572]|uniref:Uncharacterized protein n=1 Tax=Aspergillus sclerotioniger CBS 115572 TaxID=1450535 RepID=A0A317WJJ8_9EURO|nr:hypothetical protein BO94DRAFT_575665 [Aspergillus sclerotioniger CBS 115572]PWY86626.1 hypothetical protein BO94DRAFT_575665 [Aspergillus sclerotioniger CBS 115572]
MWACSLEGRVFEIDGRTVKIEEQFSEVLDRELGQRHVLAKCRNTLTQVSFFLKIRYEMNPKDFDFDDHKEILEIAEQHYCHETEPVELLGNKELGLKYIAHETQDQPEWMPYPGGYIDFLVLRTPLGQKVDDIQHLLTDKQLHASYLNYDSTTDKLYLIDLEGLAYINSATSVVVDEESPQGSFNIDVNQAILKLKGHNWLTWQRSLRNYLKSRDARSWELVRGPYTAPEEPDFYPEDANEIRRVFAADFEESEMNPVMSTSKKPYKKRRSDINN